MWLRPPLSPYLEDFTNSPDTTVYISLVAPTYTTVPSYTHSVSHCGTTRNSAYQCIHPQRISPRQGTAVLSSVW
jgi:hypothetical protein